MGWLGMAAGGGCGATPPKPSMPAVQGASLSDATVVELSALRKNTASYDWFQFKPGVKKLILSGTPDARHVSLLWYGYEGEPGLVPFHHHAKTEAIFVIDGAQSDPKGEYGQGSFYFNPPGSGHNVFHSSGLFLLSYAAPPDFTHAPESNPYENVSIGSDYSKLPLTHCADGSHCYALPLAAEGGMSSRFVKLAKEHVALTANVLLVLEGSCVIAGTTLSADTLVVSKSTEPATYQVSSTGQGCLLFELAFN